MKTIKATSIAIFLSILLASSFAHAASSFFNSYAELYTVGSQGSTAGQTTFSSTQLPYLYIEFYTNPPSSIPLSLTFTAWSNQGTSNIYTSGTITSTNQNWVSFSQTYWNTINTPGTWTIATTSINPLTGVQSFYGTTNFKVTAAPEPLGTVLFLIGALLMGIIIVRRKKIITV